MNMIFLLKQEDALSSTEFRTLIQIRNTSQGDLVLFRI